MYSKEPGKVLSAESPFSCEAEHSKPIPKADKHLLSCLTARTVSRVYGVGTGKRWDLFFPERVFF